MFHLSLKGWNNCSGETMAFRRKESGTSPPLGFRVKPKPHAFAAAGHQVSEIKFMVYAVIGCLISH